MLVKVLLIILFCIGLWGILSARNLIRKIIGLSIFNSAIVLLYVLAGRIDGERAPILNPEDLETLETAARFVDPIPQALMLTAIVVGLSVTAVALVLAVQLSRITGSLDITEIEAGTNEHDE
jgi:multicomponent Na+:H+ antiporter subunit C